MKYSILGFNQQKIMAMRTDNITLDLIDLLLLDYISNSHGNSIFAHKCEGDIIYTHISRTQVLNDLPILGIKENMLSKKLSRLVEFGLLDVKCVSNETLRGSKSYYRLTSKAYSLRFSDETFSEDIVDTTRCKKLHPVTRPGVKNYTSINNNPINTPNTNNNPIKKQDIKQDNIKEDNKKKIRIRRKNSTNSTLISNNKDKQVLEVAEMYNEICTNLSKVRVINEEKYQAVVNILRNYSLDDIEEAFTIANETPFLIGEVESKDGRTFNATFDFIMREDKFLNILEGKYGSTKKVSHKPKFEKGTISCASATEEEKRYGQELRARRLKEGKKVEF